MRGATMGHRWNTKSTINTEQITKRYLGEERYQEVRRNTGVKKRGKKRIPSCNEPPVNH